MKTVKKHIVYVWCVTSSQNQCLIFFIRESYGFKREYLKSIQKHWIFQSKWTHGITFPFSFFSFNLNVQSALQFFDMRKSPFWFRFSLFFSRSYLFETSTHKKRFQFRCYSFTSKSVDMNSVYNMHEPTRVGAFKSSNKLANTKAVVFTYRYLCIWINENGMENARETEKQIKVEYLFSYSGTVHHSSVDDVVFFLLNHQSQNVFH